MLSLLGFSPELCAVLRSPAKSFTFSGLNGQGGGQEPPRTMVVTYLPDGVRNIQLGDSKFALLKTAKAPSDCPTFRDVVVSHFPSGWANKCQTHSI